MQQDSTDLRQFKLTSGEEIVCEVLQWDDNTEIEIVVKKAMRLVMQESVDGVKYYSFRPWMVYQESADDILVINGNQVVGIGFPPDTLLVQYFEAVEEMHRMNLDRETEYNKSFSTKSSAKKDMDKLDRYLKNMDSGSNVISMFDPKKVH